MVHLVSTTIFGLAAMALGVSAAPANNTSTFKIITLDDVKNSTPDIPEITDPAKKAFSSTARDEAAFLESRPDLATKVNDAKKEIPGLLADDTIPKAEGNVTRRGLEKRWNVRRVLCHMSEHYCASLTIHVGRMLCLHRPVQPWCTSDSRITGMGSRPRL